MTNDTAVIVAAAIAAVPAMLAAIGTFLNGRQLREVHHQIDGKMEQLIEVTRKGAKAEGVKEAKEHAAGGPAPTL